jgi:site-specific DNA-methyltransferase (adenine-specific)
MTTLHEIGRAKIYLVDDSLNWLATQKENSFQAVVTDPPYGANEFATKELEHLRNDNKGIWGTPPKGRSPLPRFTILDDSDIDSMSLFFTQLAKQLHRVLVPGAHVFIATNVLLSQYVYIAFLQNGFKKRGEVVRLVQTLRGGDRPKNAEDEFPDITVMARSAWEPWGIFRKPCEGRVQDNLKRWRTGGLQRESVSRPFTDVIKSALPSDAERAISQHPTLKPQRFMRQIVRAALPLGGTVIDPFMGSGSVVAAALHLDCDVVGLERDHVFFEEAKTSIPKFVEINDDLSNRRDFDALMEL